MARPELELRKSDVENILRYYQVNHSIRETAKITGHGRDKIKKILMDCGIDIDPIHAKRFDMLDTFSDNAKDSGIITQAYLQRQLRRLETEGDEYLDRLRSDQIQQLQIIQGVNLDSCKKLKDREEREEEIIEVEHRHLDAIEYVLNKEGRVKDEVKDEEDESTETIENEESESSENTTFDPDENKSSDDSSNIDTNPSNKPSKNPEFETPDSPVDSSPVTDPF